MAYSTPETVQELETSSASRMISGIGFNVAKWRTFGHLNVTQRGSLGGVQQSATQVGMRPAHIRLVGVESGMLLGIVQISEYTGAGSLIHVDIEGVGTCLVLGGDTAPGRGETVGLAIDPKELKFFDTDGLAI